MVIRTAVVGDEHRISELITQLGYSSNPDEVGRRMEVISERPDFVTWVAEVEGKVIGFAGASEAPYYERDGTYVRVLALAVEQEVRGVGVGQRLLGTVEAWARDQGAVAVLINSGGHRSEAHRFYAKAGYEQTGVRLVKDLRTRSQGPHARPVT